MAGPVSFEPLPRPEAEAAPPKEAGATLGTLRLGETVRGLLPPNGVHRYELDLQPGDAAHLEVDQAEVDLEVGILSSQGSPELLFDSPVGREAPERVCFVARSGGGYAVRLAPYGQAGGSYSVRLVRVRPATVADQNCFEAARVFMAATKRHFEEGASEELVVELERAQALWQEAGELFLAAIALREAGILWFDLGRSDEAAECFQRALSPARATGSAYLEVSLLNRLGLAWLDRGDVERAEETFRQALTQARLSNRRQGEASALNNLALVDETVGETYRAVERYQEALPIWRELGMESGLVKTLKNLADAYALLDHHREALHLLDDALAIARRTGDQDRQATVLAAIGWVHYLRGQPEEGIPALREARELWRRLGDRNGEAAALDRVGTLLRETGDFAAALEAYQQSYAISEETDSPWDLASTAGNIGCLFQEWGRTEEALARLAEARDGLQAIDDPKSLSHVEACLARAEQQRGDLDAALGHVEQALGIVDGLRQAARERGERYRPIWLWQDYSELHHELLMAEYRATDDERFAVRAFEASDLARSRNLFELVLESQAGVRAAARKTLLDREREVQGRLNAAGERLRKLRATGAAGGVVPVSRAQSHQGTEVADLERQLEELSLELERARAKIRADDPRYAELAAPRPVRLEELRALLDPGTVLLSYVLGQERSYLFVVSEASFEARPLDERAQLDAHAAALYKALQLSRFDPLQHQLAARALGRRLLPPGAVPAGASRLLIVTEGLLNYVPFGVLPSPSTKPDGEEARLLADDFEIHHLPSASLLQALRQRDAHRPRARKTVAVFADAVFSEADPRLAVDPSKGDAVPVALRVSGEVLTRSISAERPQEGPLPRLPFTRSEAEAILALVPEEKRFAALGFAASKQAAMENELDDYRIVHFATHALIDEQFPELSGLVLSRRDPRGEPVDGDLHLHEIYGLRLAAELVVLSGCQTALGQQVRGDGLLGLTRGFFYAGCSQVLVSLWSVDDEATAALMSEFYRGLLERNESPAVALRSSQQWMRRQDRWRAPYFWAAFILQSAGG